MTDKTQISKLLNNAGFHELKEIQRQAIDASALSNHIVLLSKTGSGKTLAFLLSMLAKLDKKTKGTQAIIIAPTRELSQQIDKAFRTLKSDYKSVVCYGGHPLRIEANNLREDPAVIIGTPGRLCDHITRGNIGLHDTACFIIDEYDKCLEFGFKNEMDFIYHKLANIRFKLFASATNLGDLPYSGNNDTPVTIDALSEDEKVDITEYHVMHDSDVKSGLVKLLKHFQQERTIIFCNYREVVDDVMYFLQDNGILSIGYHGGLEQDEREMALIKFRNGSSNILVSTDLASRGLDIADVKHIVHFQYPSSEEAYIHRNGRTARMDESGSIYLFQNKHGQLPEYLSIPEQKFNLESKVNHYETPRWKTLYFSGGKKNKINKIDIVGFLAKVGGLEKNQIGLIDVLDYTSYVAVDRIQVKDLLNRIEGKKIKGKKLKIEISK
jgi:superfamily II DNA/RNA helicase